MIESDRYDARQVANCLLDIADQLKFDLTHISVQKLVYFCHGLSYARFGHGLIMNRIEAWKNGPVVRELYFAFNDFGDRPITGRASLFDFETQTQATISYAFPREVVAHLLEVCRVYGPLPPWRLVAMTHEPGTPWAKTVSKAETEANVGMLIEEAAIRSFFAPQSKREHKANIS